MDFSLTDDQHATRDAAKAFSSREVEPRSREIDAAPKLPDDLLPKLAATGLLGVTVPRELGGTGKGHLACILAIEQLAYSGTGVWWLAAFNNSIPASIAAHAVPSVAKQFVPAACSGTAYASIQFTEAATGSDPDALTTTAAPKGQHYLLNGTKRFSTFGARKGPAMVFAKDEAGACTAFLIEKHTQGYVAGKVWETLGGGGVEPVDIEFDQMSVPATHILGGKGKGFHVLLDWIAVEKVQQCAANVGMAQAALDEAVAFSQGRTSRGRPISNMQGIRWMLAEMQAKLAAARWLTYRAAYLLDQNAPESRTEAATAKLFVVPATIDIGETSRRIHGAYGYTREYKIERLCRALAGATGVATSLEVNKSIVGASLTG